FFFFSSRRRHTRSYGDWRSDVSSSDLSYFSFVTRREILAVQLMPLIAQPTLILISKALNAALSYCAAISTRTATGISQIGFGKQIGRASCRERVEIAEVEGWVTKKRV